MLKTWGEFGIELPVGASGEIDTTCPQCSAQRRKKRARCLSVNVDLGVWVCMHCGWRGTLEEGGKRSEEDHWRKPEYRTPAPLVEVDLPDKALRWFENRGITRTVLARNGVHWAEAYMPQIEDRAGCVVFPYRRDGEIINRKYRDASKNFRMEAGAERILYGLDDIQAQRVVVVEGEIDKLSCEVAGFTSVLSVPDGAPPPGSKDYASKFRFLGDERLQSVEKWAIAVDADEPGERLEDELSRRLGREKCLKVRWPDGVKDANEMLVKHGSDRLREAIEKAEPYPIEGAFTILDMSARIRRLYESGWEAGVSTGWGRDVDSLYTVRPGEFTVITGIPNSGKSNLIDALAVNLAKNHGWRIAMFSPENQPLEDHMARVVEKWAQEPFANGPTSRMDLDTLDVGMKWAEQHFDWILPDDDGQWTIDHVLDVARALVLRNGIRGLVLDPWNEFEHQRPANQSETEYVSGALKRIRGFARRYGVHVWVVAHPAKLYRDKDGKYPVPTPYDISGSAHWRNKADNCLCVWRDFADEARNQVELHVQKIRFRQVGRLGVANLRYRHLTGTYQGAA